MSNLINMKLLLESLREGKLPGDIALEEISQAVGNAVNALNEEEADRGWLCCYYLSGMVGEEFESYREMTGKIGMEFLKETREKVMARKLWIYMDKLMVNENYKQILSIATILEERDVSDYVWERFFRSINKYYTNYRLYPSLCMTLLNERNVPGYKNFIKAQDVLLRQSTDILQHYRSQFLHMIDIINQGRIKDYHLVQFITNMAVLGLDFPVTQKSIEESPPDRVCRIRFIQTLFVYVQNLASSSHGRIVQAAQMGITLIDGADDELTLFEKASRLIFYSYLADSKEEWNETAGDIIRFLMTAEKADILNSSMENDLADGFEIFLLKGLYSSWADVPTFLLMIKLLESESLYFQKTGATLLLEGVRKGYDALPAVSMIVERYLSSPETKNSLIEGQDLKDEERDFKYGSLNLKAFGLDGREDQEDSFNLDGLTGMLAMCQPPTTAFRLKLAMEIMGVDPHTIPKTGENIEFPIILPDTAPPVIGPLDFSDLVESFNQWKKMPENELEQTLTKKSGDLIQKYEHSLSAIRRHMIKSVFEEEANAELESPLLQAYGGIKDKELPGPFCHLNDELPDSLAYYLPRESLADDMKEFSGIYFHYFRMIDFAEKVGVSLTDAIKTVFVHELYHSYASHRVASLSNEVENYSSHNHRGICRLEEAACNKASLIWALENLEKDSLEKLMSSLYSETKPDGAIRPGYGEYKYISDSPDLWIPQMLSMGDKHPDPPDYGKVRNELLLRKDSFIQKINKSIWEGFLTSFDETLEPLFIDFRCK